jgi:hypothetical protein
MEGGWVPCTPLCWAGLVESERDGGRGRSLKERSGGEGMPVMSTIPRAGRGWIATLLSPLSLSICQSVEILIEKKRTKKEKEKHERGD